MLPNNGDIMYRYARMRAREIRTEVEASRGERIHWHTLRPRITVLVGVTLMGLTLAMTLIALGWWVF